MGAIGALTLLAAVIWSIVAFILRGATGFRLRAVLALAIGIAACAVARGSSDVFGWPPHEWVTVCNLAIVDVTGLLLLVSFLQEQK